MHSLMCHLDLFPNNCGEMSDEQGERFHQTVKDIEKSFIGKKMAHGLRKICSELQRTIKSKKAWNLTFSDFFSSEDC